MRPVLAALILWALASCPALAADNSNPDNALQLNTPLMGTLNGVQTGTFGYYRFNYQGDNSPFTVTLNSIPGDNQTYAKAGFNLIFGDRIVGQGQIEPDYGVMDLTYQSLQRGTYYVQVFNYLSGVALQYSIRVTGLPCRPAAEPIVAPNAVPPRATNTDGGNPKPLIGSDAGLFVNDTILTQGSTQGTHLYYSVNYPGNSVGYVVNYGFSPPDTPTAAATGMNVYLGSAFVGGASRIGDGIYQYVISSPTPGTYLIDLSNYLPGGTIVYGISLIGTSCNPSLAVPPPPVASAAPAASTPAGPPSLATGISDSLVGKTVGNFMYYTFAYPGDNSNVQLVLTFTPADFVSAQGIGFVVVDPQGKKIAASTPGNSPGTAVVLFSTGVSGQFTIQVFNYNDGQKMSYTLTKTTPS